MSQRLRSPKWFAAFQHRARRHETSAGLSIHHRRLGCELLEDRHLLSLGGELGGASAAAEAKTLADLPVAAQYAISSAIGQDQTAYHAVAGTEGLTLANPANGFTARVRSGALEVFSGSDVWSLALEAFGYGEALEPVAAPPQVSASGNRVEFDHGPIDEWFVNGPGGLQQGFVIDRLDRPDASAPDAPLTVELAIGGNLRATVNAAGDGLSLARSDGFAMLSYAGLTAYDATGQMLPASMEVRASEAAQELLIHVDAAGAEGPITIDPFVQQAKLMNSDNRTMFGFSVAIDGDTVAVTAFYQGGPERGRVYVFEKIAAGWSNMTLAAMLTATDAGQPSSRNSVAISGDTVIAVARDVRGGSITTQGIAYVFQKPSGGWANMSETARLGPTDANAFDGFGASVGISGDTVVVGADLATVGENTQQGIAYVFRKPGAGWVNMTETAKLTASDGATSDYFGVSAAISGDTVVVGATGADIGGNSNQGAAYVFRKPSAGWADMTETAKLANSDGAIDDSFGRSVAISEGTVVVGAPRDNSSGLMRPGAAYVFQEPSDGWTTTTETARLDASDGTGRDWFGASVAISADTVVVGSQFADDGGAAYVFQKPGTGWTTMTETTKLTASDGLAGDSFGTSVAIDGGTVVVGAPFVPHGSTGSGAAYVFHLMTVPTIAWATPAAITYGTALGSTQLNATASVPGAFAYTPPAGSVLDVGSQTLSVLFTPTNVEDYTTATASVTLQVDQATPSINWPTPAAISHGTALDSTQLNASASWTVGGTLTTVAGTFDYTPAAGTVLEIGSHTLSVIFTPTDTVNYTTATTGVTLQVDKVTPSITWPTPVAITYGTVLGSAQLNATASVPGNFAYTPPAGTVLEAGTRTLSVTFTPADTAEYNQATASVALQVDEATPSITWPTPAAIVYGTALGSTQLNASASWIVGGTTVTVAGTFTYSPEAGTVLGAGSRTLSVTFTPTDTANYTSATANVTLQVDKATPSISWAAPAAITYGTALGSTQLDATAGVPGTFTYTPAAGTVLGAGSQTLSVLFTPTDAANYTTAAAGVTLQVNRATPSIGWPTPAAITYGTALSSSQLNASASWTFGSVAGTFVYTPAAGTVLGAGSQTLSTTFTPTDTVNYNTATASVTLEINKATPSIDWSTPAPILYGTALDGTQLNATGSVPGSFVYTPTAGTVLGAGSRTLSTTFTPTDTTNYNQATANVTLQVNQATPSIDWPTPAAITYGTALDSTQLNAGASWTAGGTLTSVAGAFAYAPAAGTVLAVGSRTLSVTFTPTDTADYTTATANVTLQVDKATPSIDWPTPAAIAYGTALGSTQLSASASWTVGGTVESVAGSFAYTPAAGTVLEVGSQTLSVTFTPTDAANYNEATGNVTLEVDKATPAISWPTPAAITYGMALDSTQLNATASVPGSLVYIPAAGTVLAAGSQTLAVVFTPTDMARYTTATANVTLQVDKATPSIDWPTPAAITFGTALDGTQLNATASMEGSLVYAPAAGTVLGAGDRTLSVLFTPTDMDNYTTATASVTLQVDKATPSIDWPAPAAITYGTALGNAQLDATASVAGSYIYTPAPGTVLNAGSRSLSVTFTPAEAANYTAATASVTLQIDKAAPTIHWTPEAITYGTALASSQFNANASWTVGGTLESVAGTFAYAPSSGTVLQAGDQTLSTTFTPTDAVNYTTATANVTLQVDRAAPTITWAPAAITYGSPLGSTQLSASASWTVGGTSEGVAGIFAYAPPAGTVLGAGDQALSTTFTPTDSANYTTVTADVTLLVDKATPTITWATPTAITYGAALGSPQLNATASVPGSFLYTPSAGTVLGAGDQTLSTSFTPTDTANYATVTANVTLQVDKATPSVTWATPTAITYGTALGSTQLIAAASVPGSFAYTPAAGAVLGAGNQTLATVFTPTDIANYTTATANTTLEVDKATPTITWATLTAITYGTALGGTQLNPGASWSVGGTIEDVAGTFAYTPPAGTVLSAGSRTLSVLLTPTDADNYAPATASVTLEVHKATPAIEWPTPASIAYGTPLGSTELNAGAWWTIGTMVDVPGDFAYTPAAGTVLSAGSRTLSVVLTPTDSDNYTPATASVTLVVDKAAPSVAIFPYHVTYDGQAHTASGMAQGVNGEDLSRELNLQGTTHTAAGSYAADLWTFGGGSNYQSTSGTVANSIAKANAAITVADYVGVYDTLPHVPTATARGVLGENLNELWSPRSSFTNVPGGTAHWTFDGSGNYNAASGEAAVVIAPNTQMGPEIFDLAVTPDPARAAPKATARATTDNTGSSKIVRAEYFFDKPGKSGRGIRMAASDKKYTSPTELIAARLRAIFGKLRRGQHTIYVHAKDATGKWGQLVPARFVKDTLGPATSKPDVVGSPTNVPPTVTATIIDTFRGGSLIAAAEYFIDRPGRNGRGTPILEAFNTVTQMVTATLDAAKFASLKQGKHTIYVHGKDTAGNWGKLVAGSFVKDTLGPVISGLKVFPSLAATAPTLMAKLSDKSTGGSQLVAAEYFIDPPGNSGTPIPLAANKVALTVTAVLDTALFDSLGEGRHTVYVHAMDAAGNWGGLWMTSFEKAGLATRFN